ncbi:hypothetical protein HHI36_016645 [Cryptolaemus montrouzieri]|uniref:Uncharacterized protein n=1 Tax=Cryptolaemus montrouzieri TaxID=559131 RepID=A0ABD2NLF0_9CUCU
MSGPTFCSATRTQPQLTLAGVNVGAICSTHEEITVGKKMQNSAFGEDSINESNSEGPVDGKGYVKPVSGTRNRKNFRKSAAIQEKHSTLKVENSDKQRN